MNEEANTRMYEDEADLMDILDGFTAPDESWNPLFDLVHSVEGQGIVAKAPSTIVGSYDPFVEYKMPYYFQ